MKLEIESERVAEAAQTCPAAKDVLEILFPTAFEPAGQPKFQLGDIVGYTGNPEVGLKSGMVGKVIDYYDPFQQASVEFQEAMGGHACRGKGRAGHCYHISAQFLTLLYRQPTGETK